MKISVYSEDEGIEMSGINLTIGDMVIESLENNNTIDWTFADNKDEALELIASGECYAGIIIPKDFTANHAQHTKWQHRQSKYRILREQQEELPCHQDNRQGKTTVQNEINTKIISTLTEVFANAGDFISGNNIDGSDLVAGLESKLEQISSTLDNYVYMLNTFSLLTESASDAIDTTQLLFPSIDSMAQSGSSSLGNLSDSAGISSDVADTSISLLNTGLDMISDRLTELGKTVDSLSRTHDIGSVSIETDLNGSLGTNVLDTINRLTEAQSPIVSDAKLQFENLNEDLAKLVSDTSLSDEEFASLKKAVSSDIKKCTNDIASVKDLINNELSPELKSSLENIQSSLAQAQTVLANVPGNFNDISKSLTEYQDILKDGTADIAGTIKCLKDLKESIDKIKADIQTITSNSSYQDFIMPSRTIHR